MAREEVFGIGELGEGCLRFGVGMFEEELSSRNEKYLSNKISVTLSEQRYVTNEVEGRRALCGEFAREERS